MAQSKNILFICCCAMAQGQELLSQTVDVDIVNNLEFNGTNPRDAFGAASNVAYFYPYAFISEQKKMV